MKLKKILAAIAAAAVAVSTMAVNVFASEVEGPSKEFTVSVNDDADKGVLKITNDDMPAGTTEIKFAISFSGDGAYGGGAIGRNVGGVWKQDDTNFSNDKPETHNLTVNATEIDKDPDKNGNTGLQVQCWWVGGGTMTVKSTFVVDDSAAAAAAPAEETPAPVEEAAPAAAAAAEIWSGSNDLGTDWDSGKALKIDAALFADVAAGDTIEIGYTTGSADYYNLKIVENTDGWPALSSPEVDPQWGTIGVDAGSTSYSFTINADDVARIQANGMVIQGYAVTITKVAASSAAAPAPVAEEKKPEAAPAEAEDEAADEEEETAAEPAPVAETESAPVAEAPAVANATEAPATGNVPAAVMVSVMAAAGVAAVASKKRK